MRITRGIAALLLATLVAGALGGCSSDGGSASGDAVARVNGTDVTRTELDSIYDQLAAQAGGELDAETEAAYKKQILQMMIDSALITAEAEKLGADLSEDAVTERLIAMTGAEDEAGMEEQVAAAGFGMDEIRKSVRDQIANEFVRVVASSEATLTTVPATYSLLSHILVSDEALAKDLADKARAGEDFAALASANSSDTASAAQGGSLGWAQASDYVAAFADAASALKVGEISEPVQSEFGWHIILKEDEVAEGTAIDGVPADLSEMLNANSEELALQAYVSKLRESAEIEYLDETLKPAE